MERGELTPRDVLNFLNIIEYKPEPDKVLVQQAIDSLPVANCVRKNLEACGEGDWDRDRSKGGAIVLSNGGYVFKLPLGENKESGNIFQKAQEMKNVSELYQGISPETGFFIADIGGPKVVTFQSKIEGSALVDTPFSRIFQPEVVAQIKIITNKVSEVLKNYGFYDLSGLRLKRNKLSRFIGNFPLFSDNIMVSEKGEVLLVDNTPSTSSHFISAERRARTLLALKVLGFIMETAFWSARVYKKFKENFKENQSHITFKA